MLLRVVALLALAACAAASVSESRDLVRQDLVRQDLHDDQQARDRRSPEHFLQTLPGLVVAKDAKDQSFNIGGLYLYDRQLASQPVYKSSTWLSVNSKELSYSGAATIHCIQVVDLLKTGKNAAVTVQKGGIGQSKVTMKFKSQRGEKINYLVLLWGQ